MLYFLSFSPSFFLHLSASFSISNPNFLTLLHSMSSLSPLSPHYLTISSSPPIILIHTLPSSIFILLLFLIYPPMPLALSYLNLHFHHFNSQISQTHFIHAHNIQPVQTGFIVLCFVEIVFSQLF